jgi:hypothetical protein
MTMQLKLIIAMVTDDLTDEVLNAINEAGRFDTESGTGMALQIDVEDAVGVASQLTTA